jgi:hypothetical protein
VQGGVKADYARAQGGEQGGQQVRGGRHAQQADDAVIDFAAPQGHAVQGHDGLGRAIAHHHHQVAQLEFGVGAHVGVDGAQHAHAAAAAGFVVYVFGVAVQAGHHGQAGREVQQRAIHPHFGRDEKGARFVQPPVQLGAVVREHGLVADLVPVR